MGTAMALIIGNGLIMNWYYHYRVGLDMRHFWLEVFALAPALAVSSIAGITLTVILDIRQVRWFVLGGVLYTVVFVLSMWFLGMNQYEKDLIGIPAGRLISKVKRKVGKFL